MQNNLSTSVKNLISDISIKLLPLYSDPQVAKNIAWSIVKFVTNYTKAQLIMKNTINISSAQLQKIEEIIQLHVRKHKPIQYIFKEIPFLDLNLSLKPGVLIPRPETEYWCNELIENLKKALASQKIIQPLTILDLCTGTGCIGLSLAKAFPLSQVYAIDISPEACKLARENAFRNNINNITILKSDLYKKLPQELSFDLIISNPPYISYKRWKHLDPMVKKWEHPTALTSKKSGTYLIKKIIKQAPLWLKSNSPLTDLSISNLIIEMDENQAKKNSKLLKHYGFRTIIVKKDLANRDRVIEATLAKKTF